MLDESRLLLEDKDWEVLKKLKTGEPNVPVLHVEGEKV